MNGLKLKKYTLPTYSVFFLVFDCPYNVTKVLELYSENSPRITLFASFYTISEAYFFKVTFILDQPSVWMLEFEYVIETELHDEKLISITIPY